MKILKLKIHSDRAFDSEFLQVLTEAESTLSVDSTAERLNLSHETNYVYLKDIDKISKLRKREP